MGRKAEKGAYCMLESSVCRWRGRGGGLREFSLSIEGKWRGGGGGGA